jgi:threonine/homoserine/homoserine lactone efflux protein
MRSRRRRTRTARLPLDMADLSPWLLAALTGFLSGFVLSVPVGPVNLTIINEGARRGLLWALMIGFGATAMEVIYCALAFTGFASFFQGKLIKAAMELTSFVFMLYLGVRFLNARSINSVAPGEKKIKERLPSPSPFATGFVRVMGNPGVFLFWIVLAANFRSRDWVGATMADVAWCVAGVGVGTNAWFSGLSYAVSRRHQEFTERTLLRMEHASGLCLLGLAVAEGIHIVWQMAQHKL